MSVLAWIAAIWGGLGCLLWGASYLHGLVVGLRLPRLRRPDDVDAAARALAERDEAGSEGIRLSVVVPACNEADTIEPALRSLLRQTFPGFEVLVVDDRSTDGTGEVVRRVAADDPRVVPLRVDELPEGWLGKPHALQRALEHARGRWVLLTDADVHFEPGALVEAVRWAEDEGVGHLAVIPETRGNTLWSDVAIMAFGGMYLMQVDAQRARDPDKATAAGVGAFNLVRREALDAIGGLRAVRLEVADDMGVAQLVRQAGYLGALATGTELLRVDWYPNLPAMARGLDKNLFGVIGGYSWPRTLSTVTATTGVSLAPLVALAGGVAVPALWGALGFGLVAVGLSAVVSHRSMGSPILPLVLSTLGTLLVAGMLLRSAWRCSRAGGIEWRGTHYSLEQLRAGRVVQV